MAFLSFVLGTIVGSFTNALAMGLVRGSEDIRSRCDHCQAKLSALELIPLVSYLILRGRCRHCGGQIHWRYLASELTLGCIFALAYGIQGWWPGALIMLFASLLFVLVLTDLEAGILPDQVTLPAFALAFAINAVLHDPRSVILATVSGAVFFWIQHAISRGRWVGDGDIRLGALIGAMLGDWRALVLALTLSYIIGAVVSLTLIATNRATMKSRIPFAPFLALGTFVVLLLNNRFFLFF